MRKYMGITVMLILWIGLTIGAKVWFSIHPELSELNLIISACYMLFLLAIIPIGLPLHSRALEIILILYALVLGVLDVATFLRADHILVKLIGSLFLAPFHGLFYFERYIGLGSLRFMQSLAVLLHFWCSQREWVPAWCRKESETMESHRIQKCF